MIDCGIRHFQANRQKVHFRFVEPLFEHWIVP